MDYTYAIEIFDLGDGKSNTMIRRNPDGALLPLDENNCQYRDYLTWAETNQVPTIDHRQG